MSVGEIDDFLRRKRLEGFFFYFFSIENFVVSATSGKFVTRVSYMLSVFHGKKFRNFS